MTRSRRSWADIDHELWPSKMVSVLNVRCDKESVSSRVTSLKFNFLVYKIGIRRLSKHFWISSHWTSCTPLSRTSPQPWLVWLSGQNISPTTYTKEPLKIIWWQAKSPFPTRVVVTFRIKNGHLFQKEIFGGWLEPSDSPRWEYGIGA